MRKGHRRSIVTECVESMKGAGGQGSYHIALQLPKRSYSQMYNKCKMSGARIPLSQDKETNEKKLDAVRRQGIRCLPQHVSFIARLVVVASRRGEQVIV